MSGHHFWTTKIRETAALNPIDRISEVLFGLILILAITATIRISHGDFFSVLQIFLLVFLCGLPLPFLLVSDVLLAVRISNAKAIAMLLIGDYKLAKYSALPDQHRDSLLHYWNSNGSNN